MHPGMKYLLAIVCVCLCFCSCAQVPQTQEQVSDTTHSEQSDAQDSVDSAMTARDYLDAVYTDVLPDTPLVIAAADTSFLKGGLETDCDLLRAERHALAEQKLGTRILVVQYDIETLYQNMYNAVLSGSENYVCDLLALPRSYLGIFAVNGILSDLLTVPFVDLDAPYYDVQKTEKTAVGRSVYGAFGAATDALDRCYALYCNRSLLPPGTELPNTSAEGYTFAELLAFCTQIGQTLSAPAALQSQQALTRLLGAGVRILQTGYYSPAEYVPDYTALQALSDTVGLLRNGALETASRQDFLDGKKLFYIDTLSFTDVLRDSEIDYELLSLPGQPGAAEDQTPVLCIPSGVRNLESSGQLLQTYMAASYGMMQAYCDGALRFTLHDMRSYLTLCTVVSTEQVNAGMLFASGVTGLYNALYQATANAAYYGRSVESFLAPQKDAVQAQISQLLSQSCEPCP